MGPAAGQWIRVRLAGSVAYMSANYLNTTGRRLPAAPTRINTSGTKVTTVALNVRSGAGMTHQIVGTLAEGTRITLTGKLSRGYAQLNYQGHRRWVSQQYPGHAAIGERGAGTPGRQQGKARAGLRQGPARQALQVGCRGAQGLRLLGPGDDGLALGRGLDSADLPAAVPQRPPHPEVAAPRR